MARHSLSHGLRTWLAVVGGFSLQLKVSVPGRQVCFWARLCDDRVLVASLFGQPSLAQTGAWQMGSQAGDAHLGVEHGPGLGSVISSSP